MSKPPEFRLDWTWREPALLRAPELSATWAELSMSVGAEPITLVHEPGTRTFREHIVVSLYPLAEWVAFNWWSLLADSRPGTQISQLRGAYRKGVGDARGAGWTRSRRHVLRAACDGFSWPDVLFVSEGQQTRVVWSSDADRDTPGNHYASRGNVLVPSQAFAAALAAFVDAVNDRLAEQGVHGTPLQAEWAAVAQAGENEVAFCTAAARLGLDPYTEAGPHRTDIEAAMLRLPDPFATDFFHAVSPDRVRDQLDWIDRAVKLGETAPAGASAELAELRGICAEFSARFFAEGNTDNPWHLGYAAARRVREWAGLGDTEPFDPARFFTYRTEAFPYLDRGLLALGHRPTGQAATVVAARRMTDRARRFLQARALWHLICDRDETFLVVAAHTHRQHVARGFALELLAPARGIATLLAEPAHLVSSEDVDVIADDYGVGTIVVEHQLDLQVLAADFDWPDAGGRTGIKVLSTGRR